MNPQLTLIAGLLAIIATLTTVLTALWKALNAIAAIKYGIAETNGRLERIASELDGKLERMELITNGVRERVEHVSLRVSGQFDRMDQAIDDLEGFLQKTTSYEKRRGR